MKNSKKPNIFSRIAKNSARTKLGIKIQNIRKKVLDMIEKSIRFELIASFAICFIISFTVYSFTNSALTEYVYSSNIEYNYDEIKNNARRVLENIINLNKEVKDLTIEGVEDGNIKSEKNKILSQNIESLLQRIDSSARVYITDLDGKILYSTGGEAAEKIDVYSILEKINGELVEGDEATYLYPLNLNEARCYFLYADRPTPNISQDGYYNENPFLALIVSVITFVAVFIIITNRKMKYIEEISKGLEIISKGDLAYRIDVRGKDEISNLANNINYMAMEINDKIQAERRAEQTKGELITNVSHDLRTPLTSVMGYLGLVKEKKYSDEKQMKEYLNIAFNKAERLKLLIDDLFEYTKLNNNGIKLEKSIVNLNEFISQLVEEYIPMFEENDMGVHKTLGASKSNVNIDSAKMVRVLENLLSNAIKYSYKPGVVMIDTYNQEDFIVIAVKNRGEAIPEEKLNRIFDRFYRVDEARNSEVSGTGLGLAISKNIVELHGGSIFAKSLGEDITFYIKLKVVK